MPDKFSPTVRSRIMASIKQKNTKPEILIFSKLRGKGIHFQKHYKKIRGTPDIAIPRKKLAIFIDGDFWHGWNYPRWKQRLPKKFWKAKIERNINRDKRTFAYLRNHDWKVLRIWEHQIHKDIDKTFNKIINFIKVG